MAEDYAALCSRLISKPHTSHSDVDLTLNRAERFLINSDRYVNKVLEFRVPGTFSFSLRSFY